MNMYDFLIVGAGFSGAVLAERLASHLGKRVLLCDKRPHLAGNAYDRLDDSGDIAASYADVQLAQTLLRWKATRTLDEMCADSWRWQQRNPGGYAGAEAAELASKPLTSP